jgi:hypothetical protein
MRLDFGAFKKIVQESPFIYKQYISWILLLELVVEIVDSVDKGRTCQNMEGLSNLPPAIGLIPSMGCLPTVDKNCKGMGMIFFINLADDPRFHILERTKTGPQIWGPVFCRKHLFLEQ